MWRATDGGDLSAGFDSTPATADQYIGSAFTQQTPTGAFDGVPDRVDYEASIQTLPAQYGTDVLGLGSAPDGEGYTSVYGGTVFGGVTYGDPTLVDPGRPVVSFPLPRETDVQYANRTHDFVSHSVEETIAPTIILDSHVIPERALPVLQRLSGHPAEIGVARPDWDTVTGTWPWSGDKVALARPVATAPLTFASPIVNALPSPGGSAADTLIGSYGAEPAPLTFRIPPEPWDTNNDGTFVDGGAW